MDLRVFQSGASGSPPTPPASPSIGYPARAIPGSSPATKPGPWWYHQIAEELRAILIAAGLTPDHESLTQLHDALVSMFAPVGSVNSRPGHTYASSDWAWLDKESGLMIQWGVGTYAGGSTVTFPVAFPNNCFVVNVMADALAAGANIEQGSASSITRTNFVVYGVWQATAGGGWTSFAPLQYWLAIGN